MKVQVLLENVTKKYNATKAVEDLSFEIGKGEVFCLLGPSGCGKTTTLRLIAGLEKPDSGRIEIGGVTVAGEGTWMPPEKRRVGMVFQDYALFPHMNVFQNVAFGMRNQQEVRKRVLEVLELMGLDGMEKRYPHELSSGQQQRVAIARALAPEPEVILLDEPFSNLDADLRKQIRSDIKKILKKTGITTVFVTHDQEEAFFMSDKIGVMRNGRLEQVGIPEEVFHRPSTPFVAQFVGIADFISGVIKNGKVATPIGDLRIDARFPEGDMVRVLIRPDSIDIREDEDGDGVVLERLFLGTHYLYTILLTGGERLRCLRHHSLPIPIGAKVRVKLRTPGMPVIFRLQSD